MLTVRIQGHDRIDARRDGVPEPRAERRALASIGDLPKDRRTCPLSRGNRVVQGPVVDDDHGQMAPRDRHHGADARALLEGRDQGHQRGRQVGHLRSIAAQGPILMTDSGSRAKVIAGDALQTRGALHRGTP